MSEGFSTENCVFKYDEITRNLIYRATVEDVWWAQGIRVQMLINRAIGNSNKGSKRWINKLVSSNQEEFLINYGRLREQMCYLGDKNIRLYSSVNARDLDKAIRMFQHKLIDINTEAEKLNFFLDVRAKFVSCLMKPENKAERFFLIDFDGPDWQNFVLNNQLVVKGIKILESYQTPNGYHFITEPFNPELIKDIANCTIQKDGLMLLYTL